MRKAKFSTPEELYERINQYFSHIKGGEVTQTELTPEGVKQVVRLMPKQPATITGLCLFAGFTSRQSFYDYQKDERFKDIIDWAKLMIENQYELAVNQYKNPVGPIFVLKNMGWSDRVEQIVRDEGVDKTITVKVKR